MRKLGLQEVKPPTGLSLGNGDTRAHREDVFPTGSRGPLSVKLLQVRGRASEPTLPRAWGMTVALKGSGMVTFCQGQLLGD